MLAYQAEPVLLITWKPKPHFPLRRSEASEGCLHGCRLWGQDRPHILSGAAAVGEPPGCGIPAALRCLQLLPHPAAGAEAHAVLAPLRPAGPVPLPQPAPAAATRQG